VFGFSFGDISYCSNPKKRAKGIYNIGFFFQRKAPKLPYFDHKEEQSCHI
jgi:hypothetical protein